MINSFQNTASMLTPPPDLRAPRMPPNSFRGGATSGDCCDGNECGVGCDSGDRDDFVGRVKHDRSDEYHT